MVAHNKGKRRSYSSFGSPYVGARRIGLSTWHTAKAELSKIKLTLMKVHGQDGARKEWKWRHSLFKSKP
eukprot:scaffold270_cov347-Pavlova_lutheri.AAC.10